MQLIPIECFLCQWSGLLKDYQATFHFFPHSPSTTLFVSLFKKHLDELHSHPTCQYCNLQFDSINNLNQHQQLQCQQITHDCPLKEFGCHQQIIRAKKQEHYRSQQHQHVLMKIVQQINQSSHTTTTNTTADSVLAPLEELLGILANGVETLIGDQQRLTRESLQLQLQLKTLAQETAQVKLSIEESRSYLDGVKQNFDILHQDFSAFKEKIDDMKYLSHDGTFIWKITNVQEKMNDARSERQTSIYSPPFYSSPSGYKMRLRLYLYGDGNARRSHLSLFFVLMRGRNDPILKFPFGYKVTFCLYDQSDERKHIIDSFRPDIRSNSFTRPRSEMNIASGIPKFVELSLIAGEDGQVINNSGYVVDDTMFIKVLVDFDGIPKTLLPYAMTVNPGLPRYVQQIMINEEKQRRSQEAVTGENQL